MNKLFANIFRYIPSDRTIALFGIEYFLILIVIAALIATISILLKNKDSKVKQRVINISAITLITLYIFDFFVQPFWAGGMIVHKLPFHICTATGVLIPFVTFNKKCNFMKRAVTVWAILAPAIWLIFPMNLLNSPNKLYSYPIAQSYTYHIIELFWGVFMIVSGTTKLEWKTIWQPIVGLFPMALWATIGQELYFPNEIGENYMFLRTDASAIVPQWMFIPALFIAAVLATSLTYLIYNAVINSKKKSEKIVVNS